MRKIVCTSALSKNIMFNVKWTEYIYCENALSAFLGCSLKKCLTTSNVDEINATRGMGMVFHKV